MNLTLMQLKEQTKMKTKVAVRDAIRIRIDAEKCSKQLRWRSMDLGERESSRRTPLFYVGWP